MLVTLQFPLCDARGLLGGCGRLPRPSWPTPRHDDFVRSFGHIQQRYKGGVGSWVAEDVLCIVPRAVRIPHSEEAQQLLGRYKLRVTARTLYFGSGAAGKLEISVCGPHAATSPTLVDLCTALLDLPVAVPNSLAGTPYADSLAGAGKHIAQQYLLATTERSCREEAAQNLWWVEAGAPVLVVERFEDEEWPLGAESCVHFAARGTLPAVDYLALKHQDLTLGIWVCTTTRPTTRPKRPPQAGAAAEADPEADTQADPEASADAAREMRISLLRIHAERQALLGVLNHLRSGRIACPQGSAVDEQVQRYLDKAAKRILTAEAAADLPIVAVANRYDDLLHPGARPALREAAADALPWREDLAAPVLGMRQSMARDVKSILSVETLVTRKWLKQLHAALVQAFDLEELRMMLRLELDIRLAEITADGPLPRVVFCVMEWAERVGRLTDLIVGACAAHPDNPLLLQYAAHAATGDDAAAAAD